MRKLTPFVFLFLVSLLHAQYDAARYPVIPRPYSLLPFSGDFKIHSKTIIVADSRELKDEADFFCREVKQVYNLDIAVSTHPGNAKSVIYISDDSLDCPPEGYQLFVNRSEISLYGTKAGIFYGLQTLFQLIYEGEPLEYNGPSEQYFIPSCSILDHPQFSWRGMHLDVSRHFYGKEEVKNYLRWMAMYKLNTFHWHLTDDQGWRIEIKKYPKLTEVGAWRNGTLIGHEGSFPEQYDSTRYGGFYTQDEIREIVRFADSLHITIVPEIEMPGHASAMLAAYPEYGCTGGPFSVARTWGVFEDVLCPKEETFIFLDNILTEVAALFPGKYIHIGGDECPKAQWKNSAFCQDLIKQHDLKDEDGLQSWFTKRIVAMLQQKGKLAIGWDEILQGGLAEGAAVMSWRGEDGGIAAAKAKHPVVMSPTGFCYFDYYQSPANDEPLAIGGYLPVEKIYGYNPVPETFNEEQKKFILGVQANLWTEYIGDFQKLQYMLFPRICALAEVGWSYTPENNFDFFAQRLFRHFHLLDAMQINYAKSIYDVRGEVKPTNLDALGLILSTYDKRCAIKYSFDNEKFDRVYDPNFPVIINSSLTVYAAAFKDGVKVSKTSHWYFNYNLATGKSISLRYPPNSNYADHSPIKLVDGQEGFLPWKGSDWLGWWGDTLDATVDLGRDTSFSNVSAWFLSDHGSWIYGPQKVEFYFSDDGKNWRQAPNALPFYHDASLPGSGSKRTDSGLYFPDKMKARYIRIVACSPAKIPEGNPGAGNPAWLFVSEIEVK